MATNRTRVRVIGAGYVGLVTAACLAEIGHEVVAVDQDATHIAELEAGVVRIHEPDLSDLVVRHLQSGLLAFTTDNAAGLADADVLVIAVGTPSGVDGRLDTSAVFAAARTALEASPRAVLVVKSTVPPGTCARVTAVLRAAGFDHPEVVSNPEFLREGQAVRDFMRADRIVIGADSQAAGDIVEALYGALRAPLVRCTPVEAELAKFASNALLASRISFMNEMSEVADAVGADIAAVAGIVGMDRRIGSAFLKSGLGWGGSCFPKDVLGLASLARDLGCSAAMLDASIEANARQRARALHIVLDAVDGRLGATVGVLGLAFKPGTNDIRESPALALTASLLERGVRVQATDPEALEAARRAVPGPEYLEDAYAAAAGTDVLVVATEWPEYAALDWEAIRGVMRGATVLDARNYLDPRAIEAAGLRYRSLGRDARRSGARRDIVVARR